MNEPKKCIHSVHFIMARMDQRAPVARIDRFRWMEHGQRMDSKLHFCLSRRNFPRSDCIFHLRAEIIQQVANYHRQSN